MLHNLPFKSILSQESNRNLPSLWHNDAVWRDPGFLPKAGVTWHGQQQTLRIPDRKRGGNWPWCPQSMTSSNECSRVCCWWLHGLINVSKWKDKQRRLVWSAAAIQAKTRARLSIDCVNLIWYVQNQYQRGRIRCHLVLLIGPPLVWLCFTNELSVFGLGDMSKENQSKHLQALL